MRKLRCEIQYVYEAWKKMLKINVEKDKTRDEGRDVGDLLLEIYACYMIRFAPPNWGLSSLDL